MISAQKNLFPRNDFESTDNPNRGESLVGKEEGNYTRTELSRVIDIGDIVIPSLVFHN